MGFFSDWAPVLGGVAGYGIAGPLGGIAGVGIGSQISSQAQNLGFAESNLDWQKAVQRETWRREDNAVQRRKADLEAAGLSPVLAAGQAASAGPVVSTTAPQKSVIDMTSLMNAMKMKADIATTEAQKELIDHQKAVADSQADLNRSTSAIKWNDYQIFKKTGTTSNLSGIGNDIRNIFGVTDSPTVKSIKKDLRSKIDAGINAGKEVIDNAKKGGKRSNVIPDNKVKESIDRGMNKFYQIDPYKYQY